MREKSFCVYIHENIANGKVYVGATSQPPQNRFRKSGKGYFTGYGHPTAFQAAIEACGWDGFNHIIVAEGLSEERAAIAERGLIALFSANDPAHGYNMTEGGKGLSGYECSDDLRKARSERMKGTAFSAKTRRKMSEAKQGVAPWNKGKHPGCTVKQVAVRRARCRKIQTINGVFETLTDCANYYGIERKTLQEWLSGKRKPSRRYAHICASYID